MYIRVSHASGMCCHVHMHIIYRLPLYDARCACIFLVKGQCFVSQFYTCRMLLTGERPLWTRRWTNICSHLHEHTYARTLVLAFIYTMISDKVWFKKSMRKEKRCWYAYTYHYSIIDRGSEWSVIICLLPQLSEMLERKKLTKLQDLHASASRLHHQWTDVYAVSYNKQLPHSLWEQLSPCAAPWRQLPGPPGSPQPPVAAHTPWESPHPDQCSVGQRSPSQLQRETR